MKMQGHFLARLRLAKTGVAVAGAAFVRTSLTQRVNKPFMSHPRSHLCDERPRPKSETDEECETEGVYEVHRRSVVSLSDESGAAEVFKWRK